MQCDNCGHVYDKDEGDAKNNVAPGTAWADVPADFKCPECGEPLSTDGQCVYCSSCGFSKC